MSTRGRTEWVGSGPIFVCVCGGAFSSSLCGLLRILAGCQDERMAWKFPGAGQGMEGGLPVPQMLFLL